MRLDVRIDGIILSSDTNGCFLREQAIQLANGVRELCVNLRVVGGEGIFLIPTRPDLNHGQLFVLNTSQIGLHHRAQGCALIVKRFFISLAFFVP
ncbi:hypothetical protein D3C87_1601840 [compost metagenome]